MKRPVSTKADFVWRYEAGEFGNAAPTWLTLEEWASSGYNGLIHIRNRVAGGRTYYDIHPHEVGAEWHRLVYQQGIPESQLYLSAMAPTGLTAIQGEVIRYCTGTYLRYTCVRAPMREALARLERHVWGLTALTILRYHLCSNSYEWLSYLLDSYDNHTVEFSTYGINWGSISGYNTVFWEVRDY